MLLAVHSRGASRETSISGIGLSDRAGRHNSRGSGYNPTTQTPADHPHPQRPNQATPPSDQSNERNYAETQKLVNVCIAQVQVSNPMVPVKDIKDFCARQAKKETSPKD